MGREFYEQHSSTIEYCYRHDILEPIFLKHEDTFYRYLPQASLKFQKFILLHHTDDNVPFNESLHWLDDLDHWYEIDFNVVLKDSLEVSTPTYRHSPPGTPQIPFDIQGKLFTTRMPRNIDSTLTEFIQSPSDKDSPAPSVLSNLSVRTFGDKFVVMESLTSLSQRRYSGFSPTRDLGLSQTRDSGFSQTQTRVVSPSRDVPVYT